jgi:hypothetical protein
MHQDGDEHRKIVAIGSPAKTQSSTKLSLV